MTGRVKIVGLLATALVISLSGTLFAQSTGDYRSHQSGNWNDVNTWELYNGSTWTYPAATAPTHTTSAANVITILNGHNVAFNATDSVRNLVVNLGGTLTINATPVVLYVNAPGITVNGSLTITGNVATAVPYGITDSSGVLTIGSTGVVNINETAASTSTKGFLPTATWAASSILNVNSLGGTAASGWGAGGSQNFGVINYNVATQGTFGWGFGVVADTVAGNFTISQTGTGRLQFFGGSSGNLHILGNLSVSGTSQVTTNGTSSGTNDTVFVSGKVNFSSTGNCAISRGSQGGLTTSSACYVFRGDSVLIANVALTNSDTCLGRTKWIFAKNGNQYVSVTPGSMTSARGFAVEVDSGCTVNLLAPLYVEPVLYLHGGKIVSTSSNPLILGWNNAGTLYSGYVANSPDNGSAVSFVSGPVGCLYATAGTRTFGFPIGKGSAFRPLLLTLTQSATTLSTYTAELFIANPSGFNTVTSTDLDHVSTSDYYSISEAGGGSAFTAGALTLNYGTIGVNDGVWDPGATRVAQGKTSGGTWIDLGPSTSPTPQGSAQTGTVTSTVAFTDLTTNTIFALGSTTPLSDDPLPVEMTSFTASSNSNGVTLHWSMASELNNSGWDVERAAVDAAGNAGTFVKIGHISGASNSASAMNYSFLDRTALYGSFEYRLNQIDVNGSTKLSNPIKVSLLELPKTIQIGSYPNPFNPTATLRFSIPRAGKVKLEIYNAIGQLVTTLVDKDMQAGIFEAAFDASSLPSGLYLARLQAGGSATFTKMLLVK